MMTALTTLLVLACSVSCTLAITPTRYNGYVWLSATPKEKSHVDVILKLPTKERQIIALNEPRKLGKNVHLVVAPASVTRVTEILRKSNIPFKAISKDIQKLFDKEHQSFANPPFTASSDLTSFTYDEYHSHDEINEYLKSIAQAYPDLAEVHAIGYTTEGRQQLAIRIGASSNKTKNSVWIDGGIHAREWLATSTAVYVVGKLLQKYDTDTSIRHLVDNLNWFILPNANPDGYEYTRDNDRLWRKTRSYNCVQYWSNCCYGVDPNRNFDFHWGESDSSTDPCDDTYQGPRPFSEPEAQNMADAIIALRAVENLGAMITLHTFGQLFLVPYGYVEPPVYPTDYDELFDAAEEGAESLKALYGTTYVVENSASLYPASGASDDFSKGVADVKYVYTLELRPDSNDPDGFIVDADQIVPTAEETFQAIRRIAERVEQMEF